MLGVRIARNEKIPVKPPEIPNSLVARFAGINVDSQQHHAQRNASTKLAKNHVLHGKP